jgi:MraZ protein
LLFLGTFDYAMDERGRIPLPPRYRDAFRDGIVLSQGSTDRCLRIYTTAAFEAQAAQYTAEPAVRRKGMILRRAHFPRALETELDRQNRILIPPAMREYAGLSSKVLLVGTGEFLEVWAPDAWHAEAAQVHEQVDYAIESTEARE